MTLAGAAIGGALLVHPGRAAGDLPDDDNAPSRMVSFFAGAGCPSGWDVAPVGAGRLLVAVEKSEDVGTQVGTPLGDQEDRAHTHDYRAAVTLPYKSVSAANGGNNDGAAAADLTLSGATGAATTGLPFLQLPLCEKR